MVFDYGGVITTSVRETVTEWLATEGIDPDSYLAVMRDWLLADGSRPTPVHLLETGQLPAAEFERNLAARLSTIDGRPIQVTGMLERMLGGGRHDPGIAELIADLRAADVRIGLLSNSWGNSYPTDLTDYCDAIVISGEVGLRKPDPRIYRLVLDKLDLPADRADFIDDLPVNVTAAAALGMHAVHHIDAAGTRAAITALIPDLS